MSLVIDPRLVKLTTRTGVDMKRSLPHAYLHRIGAWVFLDHFGPTPQVEGMVVAAHPHTGLQTVTWLLEGRIDHRDSIGSKQIVEPGQLNLMTAGSGIAHSEKSLAGAEALHAVQLWLALPDSPRHMAPSFEHLGNPPMLNFENLEATVFIGELAGAKSAAKVFSPLVGAELRVSGQAKLPLNPAWEHGVLVVEGQALIEGENIAENQLIYLEAGKTDIHLSGDFRGVLIGGEPFEEEIVMWWNFIGRTSDEITEMRETWNNRSERFGQVKDEIGGWIPAPDLPNATLRPRR